MFAGRLALAAGLAGLALGTASDGRAGQAPSAASSPCWDRARTQLDLDGCAAADARQADERLNEAYRRLLGQLEPEERELLIAAQRKWIAFRDADCAFWGAGGGSIAPMNASNCVASLSDERARELKGWPPNLGPEEGEAGSGDGR